MNQRIMTADPIWTLDPSTPPATPGPADEHRGLLAEARRGGRDARAALLDALQDTIYRFCVGVLRDPDAALDASQETALRLLRSLDRYDGRSAVATWTLGIALNVCREMQRRRARTATDMPAEVRDEWAPAPADRIDDAEQRRRVIELVGQLSDRQRVAVVLRFFEGLSVNDTARVMGLAPGTVKATTFAALRRLRGRLDEST